MNLKIISAGAGSGKTYRLTQEMVQLLKGTVRASGIIATTFTNKAAAELQERVRVKLLEEGLSQQADELTNALIGTVHGLGVKLLHRFAFEAGVSPEVDIIADEDQQVLFNLSLSTVLTEDRVRAMEQLSDHLGLNKREHYDWRKEVKALTDVARANDFSIAVLQKSKQLSFETFQFFLGEINPQSREYFNETLRKHLEESIERLENNEDSTKKTQGVLNLLRGFRNELQLRGKLYWYQWAKIAKLDVGAKSKDDIIDLKEYAQNHDTHPQFHQDIQDFIGHIFDIAIAAIEEYDRYKKNRGLIDYTDMEVLVNQLLDNEQVRQVLEDEIDLLMVDEFQDTSPLQLEIFLKLSRLANHSVWVGDPKQSIYGFRGADPRLMQAIITKVGGVKPEDIQEYSWRSREDIVYVTNAIFTKAFSDLPSKQIALKAKRKKLADQESVNKKNEPIELGDALVHWHFQFDGEGKRLPAKPWTENCIANSIKTFLQQDHKILPKEAKEYRKVQAGDIAILCRSNIGCQIMAEALHRAGLKAAISRTGLLQTAESKLILACLKFILNHYDSLSIAEILLLSGAKTIEAILEDRLAYLEKVKEQSIREKWAEDNPFIQRLNELRDQVVELSSTEILNLLLEELDLRRIIVGWGKIEQRLANVDVLRKLALKYEEACNRLHSAASLGGFLLWLNDLENNDADLQGSGENPDAVNVLTYHKSKGLEWPIVICHHLEGNLRADVWGMELVADSEEVNLENVLGNRWLRYWVNPYSDQFRRTNLEEKINASVAKAEKTKLALQEEARLLYVGITRARDHLIFPSTSRPTKWLNRVWHNGQEDYPTLDHNTHESPWEWNGNFLNIQTETFLYPRDFTYTSPEENNVLFQEEQLGKKDYTNYFFDLKTESFDPTLKCRCLPIKKFSVPILLKEDFDKYILSKLLKAFITADRPEYGFVDRLEMATAFIDRYEANEMIAPKTLLLHTNNWLSYLNSNFNIEKTHRKYPIRYSQNGRLFRTIIDLIIETPEGLILIQNSGFAGDEKNWNKKAKDLGNWLQFSKAALQEVFDEPRVRTFVNFVLGSGLIEVEFTPSFN